MLKKLKKLFNSSFTLSVLLIVFTGVILLWAIHSGTEEIEQIGTGPISGLASVGNSVPEIAEISPEDQLIYQDEIIPLLWTDNNDNENLIIKTDRQYYDGRDSSVVYIGITNTSGQDQDVVSYFHFDDGTKGVTRLYVLENDEWKELKIENLKLIENWKLEIENSGRKPIANFFPQAEFNYFIPKEQTVYFKAEIYYPVGSQGEFLVEAFGSNGAYGLLDPYYTSGLVGMWSFSGADTTWTSATAGTTNDLSGNNNTGTLTNMSRSSSPAIGISGQALSFDGVDDYVSILDSSFLTFNNGSNDLPFSISVFTRQIAAKETSIVVKYLDNSPFNGEWSTAVLANNTYFFQLLDDSATVRIKITSSLTGALNQWNHVVFTYDGSGDDPGLNIYVNGVKDTNPTRVEDGDYIKMSNLSAPVDIGAGLREGSPYQTYFNGLIDEVRIYNRALSASEITDLYRLGLARLKANTPLSGRFIDSSLKGYWSFDGQNTIWSSATAGTTTDMSGNGNTGTLTNMSRSSSPVPGISGQALKFPGSTSSYVKAPISSPFITKSNSTSTVFAWIYPLNTSNMTIWSVGEVYDTNYTESYGICSGVLSFWDNYPCSSHTPSTLSVPANAWSFVGIVRTYNQVTFYVNGASNTQSNANSLTVGSTNPYMIGVGNNNTNFYVPFNGLIDEVRVYNRVLSASEIAEQYAAGAARLKANTPITQAGPQSGMVGNWTFNGQDTNWTSATAGTTSDKSGNNNTGTMTNMSRTSSPAPGISGQALSFDGVNDYISLSSNPLSSMAVSSVSMWVKLNNLLIGSGSYSQTFLNLYTDASNGLRIGHDEAAPAGRIFASYTSGITTYGRQTATGKITANNWYHIAYTFNGTNLIIYINGVASDNAANTFGVNTTNIIGARGSTTGAMNGLMDEVRVYNRALSASEIQELYRLGTRKLQPTQ